MTGMNEVGSLDVYIKIIKNQNETEMKTHSHNCAMYYGTCIE